MRGQIEDQRESEAYPQKKRIRKPWWGYSNKEYINKQVRDQQKEEDEYYE